MIQPLNLKIKSEKSETKMQEKAENQVSTGTKEAVQAISQCLFEMEIQAHIIHLQQPNKSGWQHSALGEFYSALGDLNDDLVEKSYCKTGILDNYANIEILNNMDPLEYIKEEMETIEQHRTKISEGYIQQMVDNILEVFAKVIFQLEQVK